jgi:tripartite-type tricarboxylate transporter receptor subunit TctC
MARERIMIVRRRQFLRVAAAVAALPAATGIAHAQATDYPSRTVRMIVPFSAGGGVDILARLLAQRLTVSFGKPVVVENHTGATGMVAAQLVGASPNDGHTLLVGTPSTITVLPALKSNLPFNNLADFVPVTLIGTAPFVLVINPKVEVKTVPDLIALLKANPKKFNFGNAGTGGLPHLASLMFQQMAGAELVHVPYRGTAPAMAGVIAGQVEGMIDSLISQLPAIQDGRLRALGVSTLQRVPALPDVPPIAETLPGYEATGWVSLHAPPRTPPAIAQRIQTATREALQGSELRERLAAIATTPGGQSPEEFAAFIRRDTERWRRVGQAANVVLE